MRFVHFAVHRLRFGKELFELTVSRVLHCGYPNAIEWDEKCLLWVIHIVNLVLGLILRHNARLYSVTCIQWNGQTVYSIVALDL